jgi:hypothetical protein
MPRNVDGEYEILLGNKQLLSVFFIVVILLAVFFSMGYVLGRRSPVATAQSRPEINPPAPVASPSGFADPVPPAVAPVPVPARASAPDPAVQVKDSGRAQQPPAAEPPKMTASQPAATVQAAPAEGQTYLQATAAKRADAELVASVLKKKGFPVVLAPGPSESVVRVLVGPLTGPESLAKTRSGLEAAGFKPFTRKY